MAQTTIADIRAKYPQYDRLSDQELADKLHAKFYAQMDKADFYGRVGLSESAKPLPSAAGDGADTQGFADPLLEAMRQPIPAPLADSPAAAGPAAGGPPPAVTPPGRVPQPQAMAQPGTRTEAAPSIDQARPPSPPPTPRDLDRILFGMMGGSSPETEAWARREIQRQMAEAQNGQNGQSAPTLAGGPTFERTGRSPQAAPTPRQAAEVDKPGTVLSRTATASGQALRNVPENLLTGWFGMKLAGAELGQEVGATDIIAQMTGAQELATVEDQLAQMQAQMAKSPRDAAQLQEQFLALSQRRNQLRELYGASSEIIAGEIASLERFEKAGAQARTKIGDLETSKVQVDAEPGSPEYYVSAAIASSAEMAPALAASAIMRNPLPAMVFMGGYSGGTSYVEGRKQGLSPHDARGYATLYAAAEGIPEALPVSVLLKPGQKFLTRIISGAAAEGAQEMITEALQIGIDKGYVSPDMTWAEARARIADAGIIGTLAGGTLGTAVGTFDAALNVRNRDRREKDDAAAAPRPARPVAATSAPAQPAAPAADPLLTAMGGQPQPVPAAPPAPVQPAAPAADAAPIPVDKPAERPVEREEEAEPDEAPQYEILDEVETVDGETRPTGRKVRVDLTTGEASVVDATEAAGTAPASAPAATRDQPESQPQSKPEHALVGAQPEPAAGGARPAPQRRFLTHEETLAIETDPQTFQYKGGADTEGVTTALQGVTRFDPNRAGQVVLFETRDGRLIVADGHQRTGLARRMAAAGQEDVGGMAAVIYREADGYTPEEVMRLAAIKNIGEGSGSAVDAARVLRSSAETVEDLGLPPQSALVRTAEGLRRLSDEAFGMVVNGRASERDGAIVGRVVANRDAQIGILGLLARLKPANAFQAESIARQAAAEVTTETQSSLFGDEEVAANLYLERAKILDNAVKRLADEKRLFGTLTERIEAITAAGNVLAKDENARRVDLAARMRDYLASQANLKGPISDALSQAARDLKAGTPVATATGRFLESLQRAMEVGGGRGEAAPGGRSVDQGEGRREEPQRQEVSPPEDDLLAAMGVKPDPATRPEPKPEPAPQDGDDLLAAMGARPARNPETDRRAADETRVRGSQSKIRTGAPQKDAGPLFDTQGDIEKAAARPTGHDLIMRGRAILTPFERDGDEAFDRAAGKDLTGSSRGRALADELAGAASLKERTDIAVRWVTEHGKNTGLEHAVILDADGVPIAIMSGHKTGVSFHSAVWRAGAAGKIAVSVHNHPSSGGPSAGDFAVLALWPKHRMVIAGHNGDRHEITATEAFDKAAMMDDAKPAYSMLPTREELEPVFEAIRVKLNTRAWEIAKERSQADGGEAAFHKAMRPAFALAMERAGMIRYTDTAGWLRSMQAEGFDFEAIHGQISGTLADRLGRAGFDVSKVGDRGGDQATGSGADAAPSRTDRTDRKPAQDGEGRDGDGRVQGSDQVATDDFDAALDAVFGAEKKAARRASDIAKDLGDLFGEPDAGFREGEIEAEKYARAIPLFREALAGVDMANTARKDVFVAMIRPLAAAGLKREAVAKMRPYFDRFLRDLDDGTITLDQEASNAPGTGGDLERDRGDAGTQDRLGKADVPAATRGDGSRAGTRGATPDGRGKLEPGGERVSPDDAAPVGTGRDQGIQGDGRPGQQPADDRDGAAGRDDGEPRVPDDDSPAAVTRGTARNAPAVSDRVAAQKAADEIARRGIRIADEKSVRDTLPLLLPEQQDDVVKIERRFLKPDGHGMLITNGTGTGKAQPLDAAVLTPQGWRRMGDLVSGDLVISADGKPAAILSVHPQGEKPIYRVEFSDGAVTECCDEHLWETQTLYERRKARENPTWACALPKVRALSEIRATLDAQHFVPVAPAIEHPARDLPVRPYTMGVILGDGCLRGCGITVSSQDEALAVDIAEDMGESFDIRRLRDNRCPTWRISDIEQVRGPDGRMTRHRVADALRAMGLMGADSARKFIPADYLISSIEDRTHLLQGLLDTDGTVDRRTGSVSFCTVSGDLADGVVALVRSLGGIATRTKARKFYTHNGESREGQLAHIVTMHLPNEISPFRLTRKAALVRPKKHAPRRKIVAVSAVGMKPAQCIAVDHPRHLYVTDDYILTHNTYSGGGVIKRFAQQGKTDILVLAPSQGILDHWVDALHDLGLSATKLESTTDAGRGIVLTTYANAGVNTALARRKWDLVVSDEAHKLSQNATGDATDALNTLRAITHRPADLWRKSDMLHADEWAKMKAMKDGEAKTAEAHRLFKRRNAEVEAMAKEPRPKVLFLSATPFAYDRNIDYGEGYLFDYPADGHVGHSRQSGQNLFMVANFGYRIRYHKLTRPDANVDSGVFEREFHEKLRREGMLSGRHLDIEPDYERRFILRDDAQGAQIDGILDFIRQEAYGKGPDKDAYTALLTSVNRQFNHLRRMQLLEAIKARLAQADIDKHLALGRKVVIFHDYNVGGGFNPFRPADAAAAEGYVKLIAARPEVEDLNFTGYLPPVQEIKRAYGDRAVIYNGTVPQKERAKAKAAFNKDGSGVDIMIVQSAAGEAGISLHDVTGGHQRVLVNLGMPTRPTTALQEEGRIRREGSVSDALFHYYTIGTTWERQAFARKIAERSGTVENLALGNEARTIRDSFIEAYENAAPWEPGEADGKGGKARDRAIAKASPYEIAKTHYFGRMKTAGRRDQREGIDFYPTPEPLAFKMVEWAGIRPYERVLEPSAGDGSIARYFPEHSDRTIVEPSSDLLSRAELRAVGARAVGSTFEAYHIVNKHHVVVMNPPFGMGGKTAMEHLAKAARHLRPGGRIVALIPTGPAADKRFDAWWDSDDSMGLVRAAEVALPAVTFEKAGTAIAAKVVILDKPHGEVDPVPARRINMTGASTIGEFFDRLEGISVPDRPAQQRDAADEIMDEEEAANPPMAAPERPAAPLHGTDQEFTLGETTHGKTGEKLWVATATKRVDDAAWKATVAVAKRHGGWFSSFRGRGAIPGYQFKSEADRQAFLDDMKKPTVGFEQPAWHGSPHIFDRFSLDKIGSGEGNQTFGWGLYFAGRKEVAEYYRDTLSQRSFTLIVGGERIGTPEDRNTRFADYTARQRAAVRVAQSIDEGMGVDHALLWARNALRSAEIGGLTEFQIGGGWADVEKLREVVRIIEGWRDADIKIERGRLYKVEVPEDGDLLAWDADMASQSDKVKSILQPILAQWEVDDVIYNATENAINGEFQSLTGREFYSLLGRLLRDDYVNYGSADVLTALENGRSDQAASIYLRASGIPGHRYLDQGSRTDGEGTYNYVIYDDAAIEITGFEEPGDGFNAPEDTFAAEIMRELAAVDDLFRYPRSAATSLDGVFADVDPTVKVGGRLAEDDPRAEGKGADTVTMLSTAKDHPFYVFETDSQVWVDVSDLEKGEGGSAIYAAVSDYAMNAGKVFVGDPEGLSAAALRRRTDNMLSTALKHGTTRHIAPHEYQVTGDTRLGVPPLRWTEGDDLANLAALIEVSTANLISHIPEVADARYDFATGTFRSGEGQPLTDGDLDKWASAAAGNRKARVGRATLKRGILLNTLARAESGERPGLLERVLRQPRHLVERGLKDTFYQADKARAPDLEDFLRLDEDGNSKPEPGPLPAETIRAMMPRLRAELDRLDLKRVRLFHDERNLLDLPDGAQGAFLRNRGGGMAIVVAASLDPMKTIHHEVIHALRSMNLFTPAEWRALEIKAARTWVEQFDIAERYPNLMPSEQIEEAIAEAFAEAASTKTAPRGAILVRAFNKIARFLRAVRNALRGAGFQTPEDIFGRVLAGQLSRRNAGNTGAMAAFHEEARFQAARVPSRQARAHMASALGGTPHIPDRRIWEELTRAGRPIWARLREGLGAANDAVDKARIRLQDRFLPVLRAQQAVMRATGAPLPADHDAYIAETTFSGKVGRHLFEIDEDYTKPIIKLIAATKGALTADDVGEWLTARHAVERNARIASINPKMPDGGSGMMTADAQAILAAAAAGPHAQTLDEIGDLIDKLRERTLKLREDAGLITHQEANLWRTQYRHYVPLKGFAETDLAEAVLDLTGTGRRFNVRGPESKRALGRRSEAFNPLQAAITQAQEVSIRAERNRVGQAIYNLAKDFPSPALWSVKTVKMKRFYNRTTGLVESRPEDPVSLFLDPNEMAVKVGGEEKRVIFHDPRLARAAGSVGADQMGWFVSMMSIAARYFSSINTMLDPEFVIRNAFRDMTAAQINIRNFGEADRNAIAKAMIRDWPKAFVGAFRGMGNKADSTWTRLYREFEQSGAKVSFWRLEQPEAGKADLDKRIRMAGGSRMGPASRFVRFSTRDNPVLGFIERTNLAVDNAIRLAAYVEARKRGWDKGQAAALAKNLTVNFNRRGEWGATINALYPFANASIQGTQILFRAMTSKRMAKYAIGMVALGIIMDAVNAGLSHEDDDGELAYDKIQDWKNRTNLAVMLGPDAEEAASIWLPYGYSLFPYLGQQIGKVARGVKKPETAMADFAAAIFLAFSPITGEDFQSTLTPTMLDPINEMAMNQDWLGRPIRPENAYADFGPNAYKYYAGVSEASKQIADAMNRATGGTIAERGWLDVSPEYIDHMFGFATGGAGRTVGRAVDLVAKSVTGNFEEIELRDVPVARSLVYATGDWLDRDRYYRFRDQVKEAHASAKAYQEAGKPVPKHIARIDALYSDMLAAEKVLRAIKKQGGGDQTKVFLAFNKRYLRVAGRQGE